MVKLSISIVTSHSLSEKLDLQNPSGKCLFQCQPHKHERFKHKVNKGFRFLNRLKDCSYLPVNAVPVSTDALLVGDDGQVDLLEGC